MDVQYSGVMTRESVPLGSAELSKAIARLGRLSAVSRAREARALVEVARVSLSAIADEAVDEAKRDGLSYAELAADLETGEASINKAISRHRRRVRGSASIQES